MSCLKNGIRTKYIGETSRSGYERIKEHMGSLRRCMEPPDESLEDVSPLLKHQWVYHRDQQPDYWAKVISKHFTAFSRQVREGVYISKMAADNDIILNSKGELVGSRVSRKSVVLNGEEITVVTGDVSKLEGQERKLIAELEQGGQDYVDQEFWTKVVYGGKRKASQTETRTEVIEERSGPEQRTKRQRLITEYKAADLDQDQPEKVKDDKDHSLEMEDLKRRLLDESMIQKSQNTMKRSHKQKMEAQKMFLKHTQKYNLLAGMGDRRMGKARKEANKVLQNWMIVERLEIISEEEEQEEEGEQGTEEGDTLEPDLEMRDPQESGHEKNKIMDRSLPITPARATKGKVRKLTEFFDNIGGPGPPRTPSKPAKETNMTNFKKSGGIRKIRKRGKKIIEEPQRAKMTEAMRKFLGKPPD